MTDNKEALEKVLKKQDEISYKQAETWEIVHRILFILESDPKIDNKGLVEKVNDHEEDIQKLKDYKKEMTLKSRIAGGVAGAIAAGAGYWLKIIFKL